ncbi:MAG: 3-isopropylmalate dehydratase small subunit [Deltaproteobacteria bacterium]|nr:3-isopropylmalate dehydratase small subunit [Deltaproteobacteria bacterium]
MEQKMQGRAFVFGKNIDTDQIYPGRFVELTDVADVAKHAMEGADPDFVKKFSSGDLIVAESNFGCGSSREHAAITLKSVGVGAILAESFGRIFYRNAINLGLPALICGKGLAAKTRQGELLRIDLDSGKIFNEQEEGIGWLEPVSEYMLHILRSGGIKPLLKKQFTNEG